MFASLRILEKKDSYIITVRRNDFRRNDLVRMRNWAVGDSLLMLYETFKSETDLITTCYACSDDAISFSACTSLFPVYFCW